MRALLKIFLKITNRMVSKPQHLDLGRSWYCGKMSGKSLVFPSAISPVSFPWKHLWRSLLLEVLQLPISKSFKENFCSGVHFWYSFRSNLTRMYCNIDTFCQFSKCWKTAAYFEYRIIISIKSIKKIYNYAQMIF